MDFTLAMRSLRFWAEEFEQSTAYVVHLRPCILCSQRNSLKSHTSRGLFSRRWQLSIPKYVVQQKEQLGIKVLVITVALLHS